VVTEDVSLVVTGVVLLFVFGDDCFDDAVEDVLFAIGTGALLLLLFGEAVCVVGVGTFFVGDANELVGVDEDDCVFGLFGSGFGSGLNKTFCSKGRFNVDVDVTVVLVIVTVVEVVAGRIIAF